MKRIIAGGSGFIGRHLVKRWEDQHELIIVGRDKAKIHRTFPHLQAISWEELSQNGASLLAGCDAVINLAGANIGDKPWSEKRKKLILESRIQTTRQLADLCAQAGKRSPALFNASAIGVYGLQESLPDTLPPAYTENTPIDDNNAPDFLAEVGRAWEQATETAKQAGVRVINMRFGIVLAGDGGVLPRLALPFRFGLGGKIGSGRQPITWIHIQDLLSAIDFLLEHPHLNGPVNFTAPNAVSQAQFAKTLGKTLRRPAFFALPAALLKFILSQMAEELLLKGQHVYPDKLLKAGFKFQYPSLEEALGAVYGA